MISFITTSQHARTLWIYSRAIQINDPFNYSSSVGLWRNDLLDALNVGLRYGVKYNLQGDLVELFENCFRHLHKARSSKFPRQMYCPLPYGFCASSIKSFRLASAKVLDHPAYYISSWPESCRGCWRWWLLLCTDRSFEWVDHSAIAQGEELLLWALW